MEFEKVPPTLIPQEKSILSSISVLSTVVTKGKVSRPNPKGRMQPMGWLRLRESACKSTSKWALLFAVSQN